MSAWNWFGVASGYIWDPVPGEPSELMWAQYKAFVEGLNEGWGEVNNPRISHYGRRPPGTTQRWRLHYRVEFIGSKAINGVVEVFEKEHSVRACREMGVGLADQILRPETSEDRPDWEDLMGKSKTLDQLCEMLKVTPDQLQGKVEALIQEKADLEKQIEELEKA